MNTRKFLTALTLMVVLLATLACSALSFNTTPPTVSNIRMTTDNTGKATTIAYSPSQQFFVFTDLSGIKTGSVIEARWYAVNVQGVDSNKEINTSDYTYESGVPNVYFKLGTVGGNPWPIGTYKVEIYLNGTKVGEQAFTVQ